ncbi:pppA [Symbiodinium natans]|uniref:PppA protein n=1 Tax=Symbiodinium natans TaxID=878477 RepID=A0A812JNB9_9DINO|nr:pppA [Symbiodinium natans]
MLPISRKQIGRDWMEFFTILVWATVILIMFLAKLKAFQDVLIAIILGTLMMIANADFFFSHFRIYKIYKVLRRSLLKDVIGASALGLLCLSLHGLWPEAKGPGVALHLASLAAWVVCGIQTHPLLSAGLWAGGRNQMTKVQLFLRVLAQAAGSIIAFAVFGLYWSFRFPGEGPFSHFLGLESACSAAVTFAASVAHIRVRDAQAAKDLAKVS